jgi:hypothetical protein
MSHSTLTLYDQTTTSNVQKAGSFTSKVGQCKIVKVFLTPDVYTVFEDGNLNDICQKIKFEQKNMNRLAIEVEVNLTHMINSVNDLSKEASMIASILKTYPQCAVPSTIPSVVSSSTTTTTTTTMSLHPAITAFFDRKEILSHGLDSAELHIILSAQEIIMMRISKNVDVGYFYNSEYHTIQTVHYRLSLCSDITKYEIRSVTSSPAVIYNIISDPCTKLDMEHIINGIFADPQQDKKWIESLIYRQDLLYHKPGSCVIFKGGHFFHNPKSCLTYSLTRTHQSLLQRGWFVNYEVINTTYQLRIKW